MWHAPTRSGRGSWDAVQCDLQWQVALRLEDATFEAGNIGLWTKADSVTVFDNLSYARQGRSVIQEIGFSKIVVAGVGDTLLLTV